MFKMKSTIANTIRVVAAELALKDTLDKEDVTSLKHKAPILMFKVKELMKGKKKDALKELSADDKKILMAYVICIRQNVATGEGDKPNLEDTARILHDEVYDTSTKEKEKHLEKELKKQLSKIGIILK
jgi:hypothetical protein